MKATSQMPAPSSLLLNFLKAQSEGICFFSTNQRHNQTSKRDLASRCRFAIKSATSRYTTKSDLFRPSYVGHGQHTTLKANYINLNHVWSKSRHAINRAINTPPSLTYTSLQKRNASQGWIRRIFWKERQQKQRPLLADDLPSLGRSTSGGGEDPNSMLNMTRSIAAKAGSELKLRCTELDENGNVVVVNSEFKKSELIAKYGLLPRDLRKIDSSLLPHILVRPSAILINLLHLRCLIKADRVLVFDTYGSTDSEYQSSFMYDLNNKLSQKQNNPLAGGLPYEFRALESVLVSVTSALEKEYDIVSQPVIKVLRALEDDIDRERLRHLLVYSKRLGTFERKAKLVRDAIDELLEADDDLSAMYLTEKNHDISRAEDDHTEIELLLESYHKFCDEIVQASANLVSNIRNTEEIIKAILDANRNSLMLLELKFSIGTLSLSTAALIAAFFGMNLKNFMEESDLGFGGVCVVSFAIATLVCGYGLGKLRRVQKVSMWGERGVGNSGRARNWRMIEAEPAWIGRAVRGSGGGGGGSGINGTGAGTSGIAGIESLTTESLRKARMNHKAEKVGGGAKSLVEREKVRV